MGRTANKLKVDECHDIILMERKTLSASELNFKHHNDFAQIPEPRTNLKNVQIPMTDACLLAYAIFALKLPFLLSAGKEAKNTTTGLNLKKLFSIERVGSDTQIRDIIDEVETENFRPIFKTTFYEAQRGGTLKHFEFIDGAYLLALDGIQVFFYADNDLSKEVVMFKIILVILFLGFNLRPIALALLVAEPTFENLRSGCDELYHKDQPETELKQAECLKQLEERLKDICGMVYQENTEIYHKCKKASVILPFKNRLC